MERIQPRLVAMLGLTAYRIAFGRRKATWGRQEETIGGRPVWILPNPSGLNAHFKPADFARLYGEARESRYGPDGVPPRRCASARAPVEEAAVVDREHDVADRRRRERPDVARGLQRHTFDVGAADGREHGPAWLHTALDPRAAHERVVLLLRSAGEPGAIGAGNLRVSFSESGRHSES